MEDKNQTKESRRKKCLCTIAIVSITICNVTLFSLFGALYRRQLQSVMWPLAIIFLIAALAFWITPTLETLPIKKQRSIKINRIIFSVLGGVLLIIDAFVFIDNKLYSLMLVTIVLCFFIGLILFRKVFKDSSNKND